MFRLKLIEIFLCWIFVLRVSSEDALKNKITPITEHNPQVIEIQDDIDYDQPKNFTLILINTTTSTTSTPPTIKTTTTTTKTTTISSNQSAETSKIIEKKFKPSVLLHETIEPINSRNFGDSTSSTTSSMNNSNLKNTGLIKFPTSQPRIINKDKIFHADSEYSGDLNNHNNLNNKEEKNEDENTPSTDIPSLSLQVSSGYFYPSDDNINYKNNQLLLNQNLKKPVKHDENEEINYQENYDDYSSEHNDDNRLQYHNQLQSYQPVQHHYYQQQHHHHHQQQKPTIDIDKPAEVLYVSSHRETSLMKTRKFPYKYYHQPVDDTGINFIGEGHTFVPRDRRISPWLPKIIHLVGAFLPLGLLLAALNKPIVPIDRNSTKPNNIMLSKWRGGDLPVEHKKNFESTDNCDDKKLCQVIVDGAEKNADKIYNILWNFATKSSNEVARKNGLNEIFTAVKKKNCKLITC